MQTVPGVNKDELVYSSAHRWRFAAPQQVLKESYLFDATKSLGVCGDWCGGPRVEGECVINSSL
jgi:predicted NAD/FAD-dependent oxidoreductase